MNKTIKLLVILLIIAMMMPFTIVNAATSKTINDLVENLQADTVFTTLKDDEGNVFSTNEISYDDDTITIENTVYTDIYHNVSFNCANGILIYENSDFENYSYAEAEAATSAQIYAIKLISITLENNGYTGEEISEFLEENEFDYELNGIELEIGESKTFTENGNTITASPMSIKIDFEKANLKKEATDEFTPSGKTIENAVEDLKKFIKEFNSDIEITVTYENATITIEWCIKDSTFNTIEFACNGTVIEYNSGEITNYEEAKKATQHSIYASYLITSALNINGYTDEQYKEFISSEENEFDYELNGIELKEIGESKTFTSEDGISTLTASTISIKIDVARANLKQAEKQKEKVTYKVLDGEGQTIEISENKEITFRFNIEYSKFQKEGKVYIDEKLVDSKNYTTKEGSTIITFNEDYVKTLSEEKHTLKVAVADGEVNTTFNVSNTANNTEDISSSPETSTNSPKTGDNIYIYIYLFVVSLLGTGIVLFKNKKLLK